ncbi:hypothetical protein NPIL_701911 [Nephila pilipes]|uniref:Uncharacterized protein n=1 Tax=Nephila pilipes TaxID=299642 RepID=A0A8X6NYM6_NEPPI|nr:hypothetical protein NPIL_701911 [Nephila pilipes]
MWRYLPLWGEVLRNLHTFEPSIPASPPPLLSANWKLTSSTHPSSRPNLTRPVLRRKIKHYIPIPPPLGVNQSDASVSHCHLPSQRLPFSDPDARF